MVKTAKKSFFPFCKHKGFTLAETLITLVIIGVVAALTVPNMIVNYQKEQTVTKLKKTYSALAQTVNRGVAAYGPINTWEIENGKTKEFVEKYILPYLSVGKNCGYETEGDCHFTYIRLNRPNRVYDYDDTYYKVILQDGTVLLMKTLIYANGTLVRKDTIVDVDINGQKGPNKNGRDIFHFVYWIQDDFNNFSGMFLPDGGGAAYTRDNYKDWGCNPGTTGGYCAALIMADNWTIADDYPW